MFYFLFRAFPYDNWTSLINDSYLASLDLSWTLHSFALAVYHVENSHYSTSCAQHFTTVVNNWGICENTLQHADNSRNVIAAVTTLRLSICHVQLIVFNYQSRKHLTSLV